MTLKEQIKAAGVRQWEVAHAIHLSEGQLIRVLRYEEEISPDRRAQIEKAIKILSNESK